MRFDGDLAYDLLIKRDPNSRPAHRRQQLVIKTLAPTQSAAMQIEGYTRDQEQVQLIYSLNHASFDRFANSKRPEAHVSNRILHNTGQVIARLPSKARQRGGFAGGQRSHQ